MNEALEGLRTMVELGGPVVVILLAMSVVAVAVIVYKLIVFARWRIDDHKALDRGLDAWASGSTDAALDRLARRGTPAAQVVAAAIRGVERADTPERNALLREEIQRRGALVLEAARSHLRILEVIGALAPLLGLLGTVIGMIDAFRALEEAGSRVDPSVLSGGIWVALMTTAVGLAVAIPVVAASVYLERRVERYRHRLQDAVTRVFTIGLNDRAVPRSMLRTDREPGREPGSPHVDGGSRLHTAPSRAKRDGADTDERDTGLAIPQGFSTRSR